VKKLFVKPSHFFRVLAGTPRSQAAEMVLEPGQTTGRSDNKYPASDQWLYVVSGNGAAAVEGKRIEIEQGALLLIEAGETHEIKNEGKILLKTINFYCPPAF